MTFGNSSDAAGVTVITFGSSSDVAGGNSIVTFGKSSDIRIPHLVVATVNFRNRSNHARVEPLL